MKRCVLLLLTVVSSLLAQSVTGTLVGTVTDATGVVAGVAIAVTNQGTDSAWNTVTNQNGDYSVPNLPAGVYRIRAEYKGFRTVTISDVNLLLNATVRSDIRLTPGELQQTVDVVAAAPVVQSETSSVSTVVDIHALQELPTNGRNLDTFILTAAGNAGDSASNPSIGGSQHWGGALFTVDGVTVNDLGNGGASYGYQTSLSTQPSLETVQEFKVESSSAKAEYGGAVAVSILTKSGTNEYHGSLFAYNRNRSLAANSFFNNANGKDKTPYNRNEFGASFGGPIRKGQTFFFLDYEGLRTRTSNNGTFSVPIDAIRNGNFAGYAAVKDPTTGLPFDGNQIPLPRINSTAQKILSYIPAANKAGKTYNFVDTLRNTIDVNRATAKLDHAFNSTNTLTVSLNFSKGDPYAVNLYSPSAYGNYSNAGYTTKTGAVTYTRTFSATKTNELRYSYYTMASIRMGQNTDLDPSTIIKGLFSPLTMGGLPTVYISGFTKVGDYGGADANPQITNQVGDTFAWVHGSHTTKFGIDVAASRVSTNPSTGAAALGTFSFNTRYTGNAFADFLLGDPISATRATSTPSNVISQQRYGAYAQDDWQVSRKLTLNLGLRYELQTQLTERDGSWANFNFANGALVVRSVDGRLPKMANATLLSLYPYMTSEDAGWGSDVLTPDHKDFAPRFGFAYRPFSDNKTVVRGGYGIFYNMIPVYQGIYQLGISNSPFRLAQTFSGGATKPTIDLSNPFTVTPSVTANPVVYAVNREIRNPYSQQWNLTIERQLPGETGLRLSYLGNKVNRALYVNFDMNQPLTQRAGDLQSMRRFQPWSNIYTMQMTGKAFTNQLQMELTKRFKSGMFFQTSFSWTKSLDNVPTTGTPQDPYNTALDWSYADGVRKYVYYATASYELPFGPGKHFSVTTPILSKIVSGWRTAGVVQLKSGSPFGVTFDSSLSGWYATRADVVSSSLYPEKQTIANWFNKSAFAVPTAYTFGNSARNMLFGPGETSIDLSLAKNTAINERFKTEFRADFFNAPNTPSFANPASDISVLSTAGVITTTSVDGRTIQLGLKLRF